MVIPFFGAPFRWRLAYAAIAGCLWYAFQVLSIGELWLYSSLGIAFAILIILPLIGTSARASVARVLSICALGYVAVYAVWSVVGLMLETESWVWDRETVEASREITTLDLSRNLHPVAGSSSRPMADKEAFIEEIIVEPQSWRSTQDLVLAINTAILCTLPLATGALIFGMAAGLAMGRFLKLREWTTLIAISFASGLFGCALNFIWQGDWLSPLRVIDIALIFAVWLLMLAWTFDRSLRSEASS